jgi:hypothetical protein
MRMLKKSCAKIDSSGDTTRYEAKKEIHSSGLVILFLSADCETNVCERALRVLDKNKCFIEINVNKQALRDQGIRRDQKLKVCIETGCSGF